MKKVKGRAKEAIRTTKEAEANTIKAVEIWRESPKFDALAQDAHVVALEELVKHIKRERLDFDAAFLDEALEE